MKKVIFIFSLTVGAASLAQAQFINKLKSKTKTAAESSVDRSSDKVVDKTVNKTADNATDKLLGKADEKLGKLFKKKKKKNADNEQPAVPASDSVAIKPQNQNR